MKNNRILRFLDLIMYLILNPKNIPFYLKFGAFCKKGTLELGLPWIALDAIKYLDNYNIGLDCNILELGGGGSTIYFGNKGANIRCFESSDLWANKLKKECNELNLKNVTIEVYPYDITSIDEFKESNFFKNINKSKFDLILVDNFENEGHEFRKECFRSAEKVINKGGLIILDDSWRYPSIKINNSAKRIQFFKSIGPCRRGLTTTDFYFY